MVCWNTLEVGQTEERREEEVKRTVDTIESLLASKALALNIGPQGALAFIGQFQRNRLTDECIFRKLRGSSALQQAIKQAEMRTGRKVNMGAVMSGVHAHTNPQGVVTWHQRG